MRDIKPIETEYRGYRFRSRLEARWAIFFDALGIEYIYESEGYKCTDVNQLLSLCGPDGEDLTDKVLFVTNTVHLLRDIKALSWHLENTYCGTFLVFLGKSLNRIIGGITHSQKKQAQKQKSLGLNVPVAGHHHIVNHLSRLKMHMNKHEALVLNTARKEAPKND